MIRITYRYRGIRIRIPPARGSDGTMRSETDRQDRREKNESGMVSGCAIYRI